VSSGASCRQQGSVPGAQTCGAQTCGMHEFGGVLRLSGLAGHASMQPHYWLVVGSGCLPGVVAALRVV